MVGWKEVGVMGVECKGWEGGMDRIEWYLV